MIEPRRVVGGLLGFAVGDALGVPVEFEPREMRATDPVQELRGGGIHGQPPGVWSDETSLTFCTVEALLGEYSLDRLGLMFCRWQQEAYWTANGFPFDAGLTTSAAIGRLVRGVSPEDSGSTSEEDNGNGALLRMLPVALAFSRWSIPLMLDKVHEAAAVTHAHPRTLVACGLYSLIIRNLVFHRSTSAAYRYAAEDVRRLYVGPAWRDERREYHRLLRGTTGELAEAQIRSDPHVISTLEAAIWCLARTRSYRDCVLKAVNLGGDADGIAALAGSMAGIAYGVDGIPGEWLDGLVRRDDLLEIAGRFATVVAA